MIVNPWKQFKDWFKPDPVQVGHVTAHFGTTLSEVTLLGGGVIYASGQEFGVGSTVFIQDGRIQGAAPNLTLENIEV